MTTAITAFERRWVHDTFTRFVPEAVVEDVLARTDENYRLGAVRCVGTVMFSDLRGFTSFSERHEPDRVAECLNRYLTEMSEAIRDHGGTLVSYMADGILAVFGMPIDQPDHADRALATSREMLSERLPRFNKWIREQGLGEGFRMGIGLNSGEVMSGQFGSEWRMEYAAVGDTTNAAARIEEMTKGTPYSIFIAESTRSPSTADRMDCPTSMRCPCAGVRLRSESGPFPQSKSRPTETRPERLGPASTVPTASLNSIEATHPHEPNQDTLVKFKLGQVGITTAKTSPRQPTR